ncbi:tyrosine-type recombinase/integrase family protein [Solirubrobacter sp. CPCC 204708]|uniref:Site-specific integrase n=1 Tax=Solirubrobacter deserti TaxID=2282478 RepID=A0ABT4RD16_9ACTN|nr:tyrosine-type recombinase/integrase [Solirubrobacter deserti]MBE2317805.1 tyrosine-type recombinase/integrase family protein [Solirubrobacter deserti]MDA0136418.1 site-specific integrase [Solirubrobacter deserti]
MSLHRVKREDGSVVWRVRWRDGGRGSAERSRTFTRKSDAQHFEDELRRRRRLGELGLLIASKETLDEYVTGTWAPTHLPTLAPATAKVYGSLYDKHISPFLGHLKLIEITPEAISHWQAERLSDGAGRVSILKALSVLGSILQRAVESERLARNPARLVRKVRRPPKGEVRPLAPKTVEAMRAASTHRDATLISVLAYAGLRPQEALALRWRDIGERTTVINASKTGQRRNVRLLEPLREDLDAWRKAQPNVREDGLVFPGEDGERWAPDAYKSWARKKPRGRRKPGEKQRSGSPGPFARAAIKAGVPEATPYTLRHSFCSLLLHEGRSVVYVARQLGHDAALTLGTYGHVIDELDEAPRIGAEEAIRAARVSRVRDEAKSDA